MKKPGNYNLTFDASRLSPGVYFANFVIVDYKPVPMQKESREVIKLIKL